MYGFVDTTESATGTLMSIQTIFNNNNLDDLLTDDDGSFMTLTISGRGEQENDINLIPVLGMHGTWEEGEAYRKPREIKVKYKIKDKTNEGIRKRFEKLKSYLTGSKQVLEFTDEDAIFYATLGVLEVPEEETNDLVGTITFLCSDPDKYGPEKTEEFTSDSFVVENQGTAESDPIFELTAKKKATFAMIANGADENSLYNLIGVPADVDEELVDDKETVVYERGDSLSSWSKSGTQLDEGKVTDGELGTDGSGIHPLSYGSPGSGYKGWYGPALMKEINPIQDFEVEMRLRANTSKPDQLYRIEFYLYDENMNVLGKMAVRDYAMYNDRYAAEGRVGEFKGGRKGYQISKDNYLRERSHFHGLVRMRRIGQRFEVYVARLKTGEEEGFHHDILNVPFNDINDEHQGKLRYVQINILRHTDGPSGSVPRINALKVTELKEVLVDQTPYIVYPDDVVTFDHKNDDVLVNGEVRPDLNMTGAFGGSFFKLNKGYNSLITWPPDTFETKVIHRDKFL